MNIKVFISIIFLTLITGCNHDKGVGGDDTSSSSTSSVSSNSSSSSSSVGVSQYELDKAKLKVEAVDAWHQAYVEGGKFEIIPSDIGDVDKRIALMNELSAGEFGYFYQSLWYSNLNNQQSWSCNSLAGLELLASAIVEMLNLIAGEAQFPAPANISFDASSEVDGSELDLSLSYDGQYSSYDFTGAPCDIDITFAMQTHFQDATQLQVYIPDASPGDQAQVFSVDVNTPFSIKIDLSLSKENMLLSSSENKSAQVSADGLNIALNFDPVTGDYNASLILAKPIILLPLSAQEQGSSADFKGDLDLSLSMDSLDLGMNLGVGGRDDTSEADSALLNDSEIVWSLNKLENLILQADVQLEDQSNNRLVWTNTLSSHKQGQESLLVGVPNCLDFFACFGFWGAISNADENVNLVSMLTSNLSWNFAAGTQGQLQANFNFVQPNRWQIEGFELPVEDGLLVIDADFNSADNKMLNLMASQAGLSLSYDATTETGSLELDGVLVGQISKEANGLQVRYADGETKPIF